MTGRVGVGLIGAGRISDQYLTQLTRYPDLAVRFIAELDADRATAQCAAYGVPAWGTLDEMLARDDIDIVLNLTTPQRHVAATEAAIRAGKHVYSEKPFALSREAARGLMELAAEHQIRLASAPDTFLGAGVQTALRMIADGVIGSPVSALTLFETPGPGAQHPNQDVLLSRGAGPLFDMGPYYFTTLVLALGSVDRVIANARTSRPIRTQEVGPRAGSIIEVEVPTHVSVLAQFESGAVSTSTLSWDSPIRRDGFVEITGTEGAIVVPDPNTFDGTVRIKRFGDDHWTDIPAVGVPSGRGVGALDIARAVALGRPHRASAALAYHVLDMMCSAEESLATGRWTDVASEVPEVSLIESDWDPTAATL